MSAQGLPLGLFIQPACLQHKYIRHANSSHIFERPERLRAVLLGIAAGIARLEEVEQVFASSNTQEDDLSALLSGLSIGFQLPPHLSIISPPTPPSSPGQILLHHPALHLSHSPPPEAPFPYFPNGYTSTTSGIPTSKYLQDLYKWANEAIERIKTHGCEIPGDMGLNQGDLYLGPGSILAIEGAVQTVCQAIDKVCVSEGLPSTPPGRKEEGFKKAFCAIRPPGHHCGEDTPSGFCYVNNVVVGAMHAYLQHDVDRAIIIDFDLHHGNGTQALVMPLNAAAHAEDLAVIAGKPPIIIGGKKRRGWKGFYGSVHDIYSYPCEDGDLDLIKDASVKLAAHGQYIENIHLQPYSDEADFYERIYPKYSALLDKAKVFMEETQADSERTVVLISAGFDACEHEHQAMQRHDRRVPTSFFARYTRDIVDFADKYTRGKVVSVLEGGYSDRALTSAAMGHAIGLLGRKGNDTWWQEAELINIEKATKKKRTGRLAPFPPEMSNIPYLSRTHALLAQFEGYPPEPVSTTNTPQGRMTLRDRRKVEEVSTPTNRKTGTTPKAVASTPTGKKRSPVKQEIIVPPSLPPSGDVTKGSSSTSAKVEITPSTPLSGPQPEPVLPPPKTTSDVDNGKIFLKFTRPVSPLLPESNPDISIPAVPSAPSVSSSLYPSLPPIAGSMAYRESSASTEGEYATAPSGSESDRDKRSG